jgi:O-antigen/teichoic acid export membrane protein
MFLGGTLRGAFLAFGLTMPGLMLQDSWRFVFFAIGRGSLAFVSDLVGAFLILPVLIVLRVSGHVTVYWVILAWGGAAWVAAMAGVFQARVVPKLSKAAIWLTRHRDLGLRYLVESISTSSSTLLRILFLGSFSGLVAVGYVQAAQLLTSPLTLVVYGIGLAALPQATRMLQRSSHRLWLLSAMIGVGLALAALAWGIILILALPRGLGNVILGSLWRPAYPLVLPLTLSIMGTCLSIGPVAGLNALGAARRSLRVMVATSVAIIVASVLGAYIGGAVDSVRGMAIASGFTAIVGWWQLRLALREATPASGVQLVFAAVVPSGALLWLTQVPIAGYPEEGAAQLRVP